MASQNRDLQRKTCTLQGERDEDSILVLFNARMSAGSEDYSYTGRKPILHEMRLIKSLSQPVRRV